MKIAEILRSKGSMVATVHPEQAVAAAVRDMKVHAVGALIVSRDHESIDGMVNERDVVRALADDDGVLHRRVADIMTTRLETCGPDDTVTYAMELVTRRRQRHVPIVADGHLVGVVSVGDLVKARLEELELEARLVRDAYVAHMNR
jgi:CBS domain-containing protein